MSGKSTILEFFILQNKNCQIISKKIVKTLVKSLSSIPINTINIGVLYTKDKSHRIRIKFSGPVCIYLCRVENVFYRKK